MLSLRLNGCFPKIKVASVRLMLVALPFALCALGDAGWLAGGLATESVYLHLSLALFIINKYAPMSLVLLHKL